MSAFKSKRKPVEFEINLTSFIDLLSTTVCFLLISAVWIQVASMEVKQSHGTEAQALTKDSYEIELTYTNPNEMKVNIKKGGKVAQTLSVADADEAAMMTKLDDSLKSWMKGLGSTAVVVEAATLTPSKGVLYGKLISTMDVLRKNNIVNIGVIPVAGGN